MRDYVDRGEPSFNNLVHLRQRLLLCLLSLMVVMAGVMAWSDGLECRFRLSVNLYRTDRNPVINPALAFVITVFFDIKPFECFVR